LAGHQITAFARTPAKLGALKDKVRIIAVDAIIAEAKELAIHRGAKHKHFA
jgi:hypothetical protein